MPWQVQVAATVKLLQADKQQALSQPSRKHLPPRLGACVSRMASFTSSSK